jgi:hypothetical protein
MKHSAADSSTSGFEVLVDYTYGRASDAGSRPRPRSSPRSRAGARVCDRKDYDALEGTTGIVAYHDDETVRERDSPAAVLPESWINSSTQSRARSSRGTLRRLPLHQEPDAG